eukprot:maker-scaffold220_size252247-snap-gene-0.17 protein:Tk01513 transcript:maker-scaffold220_size252247-snap-gene-0.17-mRNA-1 annotation:"peroxisome biogenesis factor 1-like"
MIVGVQDPLLAMTEHGYPEAVRIRVILNGAFLQQTVNLFKGQIIEWSDFEAESTERRFQVVPIRIGSIPLLQGQSVVEVHVIEDEGHSTALVVHVVGLGIFFHGHAGHIGGHTPRTPTKAQGITLIIRDHLRIDNPLSIGHIPTVDGTIDLGDIGIQGLHGNWSSDQGDIGVQGLRGKWSSDRRSSDLTSRFHALGPSGHHFASVLTLTEEIRVYVGGGRDMVVAMVQNQVRFESTALGVHSHSEEVEVVYIDALLVSSVGFDLDRDSIILNVPHYDPSDWVRVSDLFVRPYSPEDWDIIQLNANSLSGTLLNQVQWVVKNQVMLACSPGSIPIRIITVRLEPLSNQGWISDTTRIHIEPQPHPQPQKLAKPEAPSYQWFRNPFSAQQPRPEDGKNAVSGPDASYRVVEKPGAYCFEAVVCDRALEVGTEFVARLGIIPFHLIQDDETDVHYMKCVVATQMSSRRGIQLAPEIVSAFKFTLGTRVYLEVVTLSELKLSNTLVIRYADPIDEAMQQRVLDRLMTGMEKTSGQDSEKTRKLPVLVPNNAFIEWVESTTPGEKSQPQPFNIFTEAEVFLAWTLPELKTKVEWREYMPLKCYTKPKPQATWSNKGLDAHKLVPEAVKEFINDCIRLFRDSKEPFNMLLKGAQGSGKSTMLDFISIRLKVNQSGIFASSLQCQTVIGKKPSHLAQEWGNILQECVYRYPSVLIFDDLDRLCRDPDGTQSASPSQEALHLMSLASVFQKLVSNANFRGIPVLASVSSISALHSSLRPGKGKYLFARHMDLPLPQKELRHKMIQLHLNPYIKDEPLLEEIAQITEGFTPFDLTRLAAHLRDQSDLGREELKSMTAAFRPLSLMNSKLEKPSSKGWSDIGGLNNVRKVITETIVWPGKYPQLFAQCGLRLQSGLLLYGAPGTGKTLIAGVVAKECGMNLITIKVSTRI